MRILKALLIFTLLQLRKLLIVAAFLAAGNILIRLTVLNWNLIEPIDSMGWLFANVMYGILGFCIVYTICLMICVIKPKITDQISEDWQKSKNYK